MRAMIASLKGWKAVPFASKSGEFLHRHEPKHGVGIGAIIASLHGSKSRVFCACV
jgi:hypothetical protein